MDYLLHADFSRDSKCLLMGLAESGFDPLARTGFVLTEEAHHMAVGAHGVAGVVQRTLEAMPPRKIDELDKASAKSLMPSVAAPDEVANWTVVPERGVNHRPADRESVRLA